MKKEKTTLADYPKSLTQNFSQGWVGCSVESHYDAYIVYAGGGNGSLLLQSDYDQARFVVDCGKVKAPNNWDGCPSNLPKNWADEILEIDRCPEDYLDLMERED